MTDKLPIAIGMVIDESASMLSLRDKTISGFNEYIATVKQDNPQAIISVTLFSSDVYSFDEGRGGAGQALDRLRPLHKSASIKDVSKWTTIDYRPRGNTPLLDAVGTTIKEMTASLKSLTTKPTVMFIIMTDGEENSSAEYTREQIQKLIAKKEKKGWAFTFLGANLDQFAAERISGGLGVSRGSTISYAGAATADVYTSLGHATELRATPRGQSMTSDELSHETRSELDARRKKQSSPSGSQLGPPRK